MIRLTRKDGPFGWTTTAQKVLETLKEVFTSASVLLQPIPAKPFSVETHASNFAIGVILFSRIMQVYSTQWFTTPASSLLKKNYLIYDKELGAIIEDFEEWRPCPVGA